VFQRFRAAYAGGRRARYQHQLTIAAIFAGKDMGITATNYPRGPHRIEVHRDWNDVINTEFAGGDAVAQGHDSQVVYRPAPVLPDGGRRAYAGPGLGPALGTAGEFPVELA
jgi:hypothetical protein